MADVSFGGGDDEVYVASDASVGAPAAGSPSTSTTAQTPAFDEGWLDFMQGELSFSFGEGSHKFVLSDARPPLLEGPNLVQSHLSGSASC